MNNDKETSLLQQHENPSSNPQHQQDGQSIDVPIEVDATECIRSVEIELCRPNEENNLEDKTATTGATTTATTTPAPAPEPTPAAATISDKESLSNLSVQEDKNASEIKVEDTRLHNENVETTATSPRPIQRCPTALPKRLKHVKERSNSAGKLYNRRVSFPENDNELVTGYLEPANPWASVKPVACVSELAEIYKESCEKHSAKPIDTIMKHLETLDLSSQVRRPVLNLREQMLTAESCEALEEVLKRVQYKLIDLTSCGLDDISATALFDMIEYYEAANEIDISENSKISTRGWQSCINMIKRSNALQILSTRCTPLSETNAINLGKAMLGSSLHTLKLENCGLTGRPVASLCNYLRRNTVLKELWLAYNDLTPNDAFNIGVLLKSNFHLQFLDVSNNQIEDLGILHLTEALIEQAEHFKSLQESLINSNNSSSSSSNSNNSSKQDKPNELSIISLDETKADVETNDGVQVNATISTVTNNTNTVRPPNGRSILETLLESQKQNTQGARTIDKVNDGHELNDNNQPEMPIEKGINNNLIESIAEPVIVVATDHPSATSASDIELKIVEECDLNKSSTDLISFSEIVDTSQKCNKDTIPNSDIDLLTGNTENNNSINDANILFPDSSPIVCEVIKPETPLNENSEILSFDIFSNTSEKVFDVNENNSLTKIDNSLDLSQSDLILIKDTLNVNVSEPSAQVDNTNIELSIDAIDAINAMESVADKCHQRNEDNENEQVDKDANKTELRQHENDLVETIVQIDGKNDDDGDNDDDKVNVKGKTKENIDGANDNKAQKNNLSNIVIEQPTEILPIIPITNYVTSTTTTTTTTTTATTTTKLPHSPNLINKSYDLPLTPDSSQSFDNSCDFSVQFQASIMAAERSFSSESLNSEASVDSNDSKSSIKLTEAKFSKNGTLERQVTTPAPNPPTSAPSGLQVLILWNNRITRQSAKTMSDLISATSTLEILNIGCNVLSNDFIMNTSASLKTNTSLTNLGLQGAHLTCAGIRMLADILEFGGNNTLQRIDLRDNHIQVTGLTSLNDALKSNKSIIRLDLDDVPRRFDSQGSDSTIDYSRMVNNIRAQCARNENPPEPEPVRTVKRIRTNFLSSRKISLTCHSIRSSAMESAHSKSERHLLDPNRKASGRLRSPLPSPIPSPVSSPVPSPSRSRFQVSRVIETSTSPITPPPSNSCSPTSFTSSSTSRFRVTVVEQSNKVQSTPAPVSVSANSMTKESQTVSTSKSVEIDKKSINNTPSKNLSEPIEAAIVHSLSTSLDSPDLEVKRYMDDSCSSISSIDSIDRHQDFNTSNSSIDSFGLIINDSIKSPMSINDPELSIKTIKSSKFTASVDSCLAAGKFHDSLSSLEVSTCSTDSMDSSSQREVSTPAVSSNEGTLTSSPSSVCLCSKNEEPDSSTKHQQQEKRVRKSSWIPNPMIGMSKGDSGYPATLDKLLSLFQHPGNFFARSTNTDGPSKKDTSSTAENKPPSRKESPMGGLFAWAKGKDTVEEHQDSTKVSPEPVVPTPVRPVKSPLQTNVSPENTISAIPVTVECLSGKLKQEMKENISPEHTITATSIINIKSQLTPTHSVPPPTPEKVRFEVGGDDYEDDDSSETATSIQIIDDEQILAQSSSDFSETTSITTTTTTTTTAAGTRQQQSTPVSVSNKCLSSGLGQIARDSLSILKASSTNSQDSMRSLESLAEHETAANSVIDAQSLQ